MTPSPLVPSTVSAGTTCRRPPLSSTVAVRAPTTPRRCIEERIDERAYDQQCLVERLRRVEERAPSLCSIARLPQSAVRYDEARRQRQSPAIELGGQRSALGGSAHRSGRHDGNQVHQIAVPSRGAALLAVALVRGRDLVGDVVYQRVGPVTPLSHLGDHPTRERRHVLRLAGHAEVRPH